MWPLAHQAGQCTGQNLRPMSCTKTRGKKSTLHPEPDDPPRRRANSRRGVGTFEGDRPPIMSLISRDTGECRYWVLDRTNQATVRTVLHESLPLAATVWLYTDGSRAYPGSYPRHASVNHSVYEWARDDDGDGRREVHCNSCEGRGAALRTFLRPFRGVHKDNLFLYVAVFEVGTNAKRITPALVRRFCFPTPQYAGCT